MSNVRTQKVFHHLFSGGSSVSLANAIRRAGFSESYARSPHKLTNTKAWRDCLDEYLPRSEVFDIHKELLGSVTISKMSFPAVLSNTAIEEILAKMGYRLLTLERGKKYALVTFVMPDNASRMRAVDMAYRVRGEYKKNHDNDAEDASGIRALSDTELMAELKALRNFFRKEPKKTAHAAR